jgi:demethylmenaquinone methyltransferase/2-methoxy-6-polyprenyl-1,4-benzoquinol methylase
MADSKVQFGDQDVSPADKTRLVGNVFSSVAARYDLMNDLMSFGSHRLMKRMTVEMSGVRPGHHVLDLAGGTGDMAALFAPLVGAGGSVVLADSNASMVEVGRDRLFNDGLTGVRFCQANGEALPFDDHHFDCATIAFGLRNFTNKSKALHELQRVLKPGGVLLVLEFSKPVNPLVDAAYAGFQALWPGVGKVVVGEGESYRYLVESIRLHPSQQALKLMIEDANFHAVEFHNLLGGIVAIHRAVA